LEKLRVLLVDDHSVVRQGLRRLLEVDDEVEVVGEAGDGRIAVDMAQRTRPDVVVMDIALPELNGIEATRQIIDRNSGSRVIILTMHGDEVYVRQCLKAGARAYLLKDCEDLDLVRAVKEVGRGGSFFSPRIARILLDGYVGEAAVTEREDGGAHLTGREREVLQLIAEGKTSRDIAQLLGVSVNTAETHRKHVMEKFDLHNTAELVRFAVRRRIVS
jgi:two-component system response regulator NreC